MISCGSGWRSTLWSTSSLFPPFLSPSTWTEAGLVSLDKYAEWTPGGAVAWWQWNACFEIEMFIWQSQVDVFIRVRNVRPVFRWMTTTKHLIMTSVINKMRRLWLVKRYSNVRSRRKSAQHQETNNTQVGVFFFFSSQVNSWCPWVFMIDFYGDTEQFKN